MENKAYIEALNKLAENFEENAKKLRNKIHELEAKNKEEPHITPTGTKNALKLCMSDEINCSGCPYNHFEKDCSSKMMKDALAMIESGEKGIADMARKLEEADIKLRDRDATIKGLIKKIERTTLPLNTSNKMVRKQTAREIRESIVGKEAMIVKIPYKKKYVHSDVLSIVVDAVNSMSGKVRDICKKIEEE